MTGFRAFFALHLFFFFSAAMAIEEPDFEVLEQTSQYEIRRYVPYIVAEVQVQGDLAEAGNRAFRILAAYIFGENLPGEKMEMTAPVESRNAGEPTPRAMTAAAAVGESPAGADTYIYGFVMPRKYTMDTLPRPRNPDVRLRQQESRVVAVRKYSGRWTQSNYRRNESELLDALAADGIGSHGEPVLARYNPPFTPWFLRRNEVMLEIDWRH